MPTPSDDQSVQNGKTGAARGSDQAHATLPEPTSDHAWGQIREALRDLRFGQVSVIVQDGVVVQIDRLERRRLDR